MSQKTLRQLYPEDIHHFAAMDTGIEDDYIFAFFDRFATEPNRLFGLFIGNQLAAIAGYSIFAGHYAMLGRLRSDRRYQGRSLATDLMTYVKEAAWLADGVKWVGSNTEEKNIPARRVLEKSGLTPRITQYAAVAADVSGLQNGGEQWRQVTSLEEKKAWLQEAYLKRENIFPYQCYYPFPASEALLEDEELQPWKMYENKAQDRFFIAAHDQKRTHYLHVGYPWNDFSEQPGLWETIADAKQQLTAEVGEETKVWLDLPKKNEVHLPEGHPFQLESIWVLHEA